MSEFRRADLVKSRRFRRCDWCSGAIQVGEQYVYMAGKTDGEFWVLGWCPSCTMENAPWAYDTALAGTPVPPKVRRRPRRPRRRLTPEQKAALPLRAFKVSDRCEEYQEVVFARTRGEAMRRPDFAAYCDFIDVRAVRAPQFDDCACVGGDKANGPTAREYLERDWWYPCCDCDRQVWGMDEAARFTEGDRFVLCERCAKRREEAAAHSARVIAAARAAAERGEVLA